MANFEENFSPKDAPKGEAGPFRAKVVGYLDGTYSGNLRVEVLTEGGTTGASGQQYTAKYLSPFLVQQGYNILLRILMIIITHKKVMASGQYLLI